jgi:hypothetical protein
MLRNTKRIIAVGAPFAVLATAGVAFAAWTASGNGLGSAKATTMSVNVQAAAAPTADLFPGGSAGALVVKVNNPNSGPIVVTSIATNASGSQGGCTTPALTFTPGSVLTSNYDAAARTIAAGSSASFTLPGTLAMGDASNDCQGADLTYPVTVSAATP